MKAEAKPIPTLAVSMGDPAGVGPEVVLKALVDPQVKGAARFVVVGDLVALEKTAEMCGISLAAMNAEIVDVGVLLDPAQIKFGELSADCGNAAVECVRVATEMCLKGDAQAIVTAPLNKEAVTMTGRTFSGHTEYIAGLCGAKESRMLLASKKLSTVHVTTHVPLRTAAEATSQRILRTIELGNEAMQLLGFECPRIAVCGLNPHAGEHGLFGREEELNIVPAIRAAQAQGIESDGPHAPDSIFIRALRGEYDLVVAMYHDQGHIPMKLIDFEQTVNISLGIPVIRTSVDHGTAFDIAGKNKADSRNMIAALTMGATMAVRKMQRKIATEYSAH
jgi:4-hydroxythreonine-4-phosphate dehydrogenase